VTGLLMFLLCCMSHLRETVHTFLHLVAVMDGTVPQNKARRTRGLHRSWSSMRS
jgi:hypothetical protein